ncbi:MAG: DUF1269 domain-containing protein [Coriobacteriales bacterium]|nr:DUF1269 domain-containing protein [Coriobacteriales bacterium]
MADTPMTALVATFEDTEAAEKWLQRAHDGDYEISEGIVIYRDAETGKVHKHLTNLPGIAAGAGVGAVIGVVLGALFPPALLAEALALAIGIGAGGAIAGAGAVAIKDEVVDRNAFKEVGEALEPGQSALVVVMPPDTAENFESELSGYLMKQSQTMPAR